MKMSYKQLKKAATQTNNGQKVTGESESGLPRPMFNVRATLDLAAQERLEEIRRYLMQERDRLVADSEVFEWLLTNAPIKETGEAKDAARREACEDKETPEWLRREILARDGYKCLHCDRGGLLHVHHIIFRKNGGRTSAENLMALCLGCHGMIHAGMLRIEGESRRRWAIVAIARLIVSSASIR